MIHGFYRRNLSTTKPLAPAILNGSHSCLNIDPQRKTIITWGSENCWLAQAVEKQATDLSPFTIDTIGNVHIVAWASLYKRQELAQKLAIDNENLSTLSDGFLILMAYLRFGEQCLTHLCGDFSFAIYNQASQQFFCARDPLGVRPFYYTLNDNYFIFSSSMSLFHVLDEIQLKPDLEWAAKFLVANMSMDFQKTAYPNIFKLKPGHKLIVNKKNHFEQPWFAFHCNKIRLNSSRDYIEMYQEQLNDAIRCRVQTSHTLGSELSGGLDSSTVTAYAAHFYPGEKDNLHSFGFASLQEEAKYIAQLNQHCTISKQFIAYHLPQNTYEKELIFLKILGAPIEHSSAQIHEPFYQEAATQNVRILLSGFGGDEFVTSIHGDLMLYELLKNKQYVHLYKKFKGNALTKALRLIKFIHKTDKHGGKVSQWMQAASLERWPNIVVAPELIETYSLYKSYEDLFHFDHGYNDMDAFILERRLQPFIATRMENCSLLAASYGIEYRWPLLDPKLIQTFLSIPNTEKFHQGVGRYLHKRAVNHMLPEEIVWKRNKNMGKKIDNRIVSPTLLDDYLHQDLHILLDINKLKAQEKIIDASRNQESSIDKFHMMQNIHQVNSLNRWLNEYFSSQCHWTGA